MKILVTGAGGFVGRHLTKELLKAGHDVVLTGLVEETLPGIGNVLPLDISNQSQCERLIRDARPDAAVHLAGISHTANKENAVELMFEINVLGAANISRAMGSLADHTKSKQRLLLFVSSAFVYGGAGVKDRLLCDEGTETSPRTKYGESKLAAEYAVRFFEHDGYKVYIARPFNHIGPGQDPSFVVPGFVNRIKSATEGGVIETGDLNALRDFTDVRDIVRGYRSILETAPEEKLFVFGSGKSVSIQQVLDNLLKITNKNLTSKVNQTLLRAKEPEILANPSLAKKILNWAPGKSLNDTLQDIWAAE